jgi:DNA topoisomerase-1
LIKGKVKVELPKETKTDKLTLENVKSYFSKKKGKKSTKK